MKREIKRRLLLALLSMSGVIVLIFCGAGRQKKDPFFHVGVVVYDRTDTFLGGLVDAFKEDLELLAGEMDVSVKVKYADSSQRNEDMMVEELLDEGCSLICVNLVDRAAPSSVIHAAQSREVPVIFFNREPVEEDLNRWNRLYYVGANAKESGDLQGEEALRYLKSHPEADRNGDGEIEYVLFEGEAGHQDAIIRTDRSLKKIKEGGIKLQELNFQIANWSRTQAKSRMIQLINRFGNQIEMVLCNNDDMALGVSDAYEQMNKGGSDRPLIYGVDGTKEGLQALQEGRISGTVYNDKEAQALVMAQMAIGIERGQVPEEYEVPELSGKILSLSMQKEKVILLPYAAVEKRRSDEWQRRQERLVKWLGK